MNERDRELIDAVKFVAGCAFYILGAIAMLIVTVLIVLQECR